jgi:hypothetical protein
MEVEQMVTERVTEKRQKIPRPMFLPRWARKIDVEKTETETALFVYGTGANFGPQHRQARSQPVVQDKPRHIEKQQRARRLQPPQPAHLLFAEADNPEKQLKFVKRFGPVLASRVENPIPESYEPGDEYVEIVAYQDLSVLDAEQKLFSRICELTGLVGKLTDWASSAFAKEEEYSEGCIPWPEFEALVGSKEANNKENRNRGERDLDSFLARNFALAREERSELKRVRNLICEVLALIASYPKDVKWEFAAPFSWANQVKCLWLKDESAYLSSVNIFRIANDLLCDVFNLFPLTLFHSNGIALEMPDVNPSGVRSALYYTLRMEYLYKRKMKICARDNCRAYFIPKAGNVRYCSKRCENADKQRRFRERARLATQRKVAKKASKRRVGH